MLKKHMKLHVPLSIELPAIWESYHFSGFEMAAIKVPWTVGTIVIWAGDFLDLPILGVTGHVVGQLRLVHKIATTVVTQMDLQESIKNKSVRDMFTWLGWSECTWTASSSRFSVWKPQLGMRHSYFMAFPSFAWTAFMWIENPFWVTKLTSQAAHR